MPKKDILDGGVGSKIKLQGLKGGLGSGLVLLEQTAINLPPEEVDELISKFGMLLRDAFEVLEAKIYDIKLDSRTRAFTKLIELQTTVTQLLQAYQALSGYRTQTLELPAEELQKLREVSTDSLENVEALINRLDQKIKEKKQTFMLEAGLKSADEETNESMYKSDINQMQIAYLKRRGYITEEGKWTGKLPEDTDPVFVRKKIEELQNEQS